jgi:OTU-like cysteine protease
MKAWQQAYHRTIEFMSNSPFNSDCTNMNKVFYRPETEISLRVALIGTVERYRKLSLHSFQWLCLLFLCICRSSLSLSTSRTVFSSFQFAPNGVCLSPKLFTEHNLQQSFTMRNVPGEGDCMFLAVALATAASMGVGGNEVLLRAISRETRDVVATVLESKTGSLHITGRRQIQATDLLKQAAAELRMTTEEYLRLLRTEGREGGLYGGGPELTVLANVLRRPISIYELDYTISSDVSHQRQLHESTMPIVRKGVFGEGTFRDPLLPDNAVVQVSKNSIVGAYSWHLHILVVDVTSNEKHACVLFPHTIS